MSIKFKTKESGAAMLFFIIFFVTAASAVSFSLARAIYSDIYVANALATSKQSYVTAEAAVEDAVYRVMKGFTVTATSTITSLAGLATTSVTYNSSTDTYTVKSTALFGKSTKVSVVELATGAGSAFSYGLQSGNGGFDLVNSASITGNAFSNGSIVGQGSSIIRGDVISAGPSGLISKITATGTAYAHTLDNSTISKDAYYNAVGAASAVGGVRYTPAVMPSQVALPIPDSTVDEWKNLIQTTGTIIPATSCTAGWYVISADTTIGNIKFECNLRIRKTGGSTVVTLTGPVWVTGNIEIEQGPTLAIDASLGRRSVQIIADNPTDRLTSSKIEVKNSTQFNGSGHVSSFIMLLSQNNSSELGGAEIAIKATQAADGKVILYAGHGLIDIGNSITLKSVTGYKISVGNNSNIIYDSGMSSLLFSGGPGGGYIVADWYQQ